MASCSLQTQVICCYNYIVQLYQVRSSKGLTVINRDNEDKDDEILAGLCRNTSIVRWICFGTVSLVNLMQRTLE